MALTKLRLGQIDLRDLESSELASANSVGNALSNLSTVGATSNTLMGTVSGNVSVAVDTLQDNVDTQTSSLGTISDNIDADASTFAAYATYANSTFTTQTYVDGEVANLVAGAGSSLDTLDELAAALNDDANAASTLTTTIGTVSGNVTTYSTDLDSVSSNIDSYATYANTQINSGGSGTFAANGESVSNTIVYFEGGDGISLTTNTTSQTLTLSMEMSNATTQEISMNGASNVITLTKGAANANMLLVFYNGLAQRPSEYTVSGTTLTLSNSKPIIAGSNVEVRHFDFFPVTGVSSGGGGGFSIQGTNFIYSAGGKEGGYTGSNVDRISKTPVSSDTGMTDVAELSSPQYTIDRTQISSSTTAYTNGDRKKFLFTSDTPGAATSAPQGDSGGWSTSDYGYSNARTSIKKFPFSSDTEAASTVGSWTTHNYWYETHTTYNTEYGYVGGGYTPDTPGTTDKIDKYPFSSDTNSSAVGSLNTSSLRYAGGHMSTTYGYAHGGHSGPPNNNSQTLGRKYPFASDTNASTVGSLAQSGYGMASGTGDGYGYIMGGLQYLNPYPGVARNSIQKFSHTSEGTASNIGSLVSPTFGNTGHQY